MKYHYISTGEEKLKITDNTKYWLKYKITGTPTAVGRAIDITSLMKNLTLSTKVEDATTLWPGSSTLVTEPGEMQAHAPQHMERLCNSHRLEEKSLKHINSNES